MSKSWSYLAKAIEMPIRLQLITTITTGDDQREHTHQSACSANYRQDTFHAEPCPPLQYDLRAPSQFVAGISRALFDRGRVLEVWSNKDHGRDRKAREKCQ